MAANPFRRAQHCPPEVLERAGLRRVLAAAGAADGSWLLGTRDRLVVLPPVSELESSPRSMAWETVEHGDWDVESHTLRVVEVTEYGEPKTVLSFELSEPGLLLQLLRERVTASVVLQRRVEVPDGGGLQVVARRAPQGGPISWVFELDAGVDPADPEVVTAAQLGLAAAKQELGAD